jgi:hypothetical protein
MGRTPGTRASWPLQKKHAFPAAEPADCLRGGMLRAPETGNRFFPINVFKK